MDTCMSPGTRASKQDMREMQLPMPSRRTVGLAFRRRLRCSRSSVTAHWMCLTPYRSSYRRIQRTILWQERRMSLQRGASLESAETLMSIVLPATHFSALMLWVHRFVPPPINTTSLMSGSISYLTPANPARWFPQEQPTGQSALALVAKLGFSLLASTEQPVSALLRS